MINVTLLNLVRLTIVEFQQVLPLQNEVPWISEDKKLHTAYPTVRQAQYMYTYSVIIANFLEINISEAQQQKNLKMLTGKEIFILIETR